MQTKSIIQTSANVIRITNLVRGDIYKRFDEKSYSDKVVYGVVEGVYNNGEQTYIQAVEYKYSYSTLEANIKVIAGTDEVAIFPATLEDIQEEFSRCEERTKEEIEKKKKELASLEKALEQTQKLVSGELQKELHQTEYKELTQAEFNLKKREIEERKAITEDINF